MEDEVQFKDDGWEYCDDCGYCACCCLCDLKLLYEEEERQRIRSVDKPS